VIIDLVDIVADDVADGLNRMRVEVGAAPVPALVPKQEADYPVVGPEIEPSQTVDRAEHRADVSPLGLLGDRLSKQLQMPFDGGFTHG